MRLKKDFDKLHHALMWLILETYEHEDVNVELKGAMTLLVELQEYIEDRADYKFKFQASNDYDQFRVEIIEADHMKKRFQIDGLDGNISSPYFDKGWQLHNFKRIR